jgi:hypothetical protein
MVGGALLALAITLIVSNYAFTNKGEDGPGQASSAPAQVPEKDRAVPLSPAVTKVAGTFITTAVMRQRPAVSWKIAGHDLRVGLTFKQWRSGETPVIPFPPIKTAKFRTLYSLEREAMLEVAMFPKAGYGEKPTVFSMVLNNVGTKAKPRWVVNYWGPRAQPGRPEGSGT